MKVKLKCCLTLVFALIMQCALAQNQTVTGTVTDNNGMPLPGVNIAVQGSDQGTQTDFNGTYSISVSQGAVLEFTFVGFKTQSITVGVQSVIDVQLEQDINQLEQVMVVGYSKTTKQSFTGTAVAIDGEELVKKNVSSATQALEGEVAGVRIINTSGQPGSAPTIRIRGYGSVNGNRSPLIVVDGVPFNGSINAINPEDIKSLVVLKDATATAIYGSRGANGVLVIETKSGKKGESNISVSLKTGTNMQILPRYDVIKSPERYIGLSWESFRNLGSLTGEADPVAFANSTLFSSSGIDPKYNMWDVNSVADLIDPATGMVRSGVARLYSPEDWEDYAFQSSARTEANVRFSGGSEKTNYYASFGYLNDKGYSVNSDFSRYTIRLNLDQDIKEWLTGSLNLGYTISQSNQNGQTEDSNSVFWFVDNIPSIYPLFLRDADGNKVPDPIYGGNQYDYGVGRGFGALTNAIADATYNLDETNTHQINVSNNFTATIIDGLTVESNFGLQYVNSGLDQLTNPFYGSAATQNGSIYKAKGETLSYNFSQIARYHKSFGLHNFDLLAAHETNSYEYHFMNGFKSNLVIPDIPEFNNAVVSTPSSSYTLDNTLESYFAQLLYDFDNRYFFSGTIRRDGSSRFSEGNKWGTFGSVGASWVVTNEDFMKDTDWLEFLKVKASYGLTGEQAGVGYYPWADLYETSNLNDEISLAFNTKGNPDLTWETSKMAQFGVEFGISKYLEGSVDYYIKNTKNLLFDRRVPPSLGYAIITVNDGKLRNAGLEFNLTGHILKGKDYYLDVNINGAHLKNELTQMPIDPSTGEPKAMDVSGYYGRSEGHSLYDYYIREWAGVDPATGVGMWNQYYDDVNNNGALDAGEAIASKAVYMDENPNANIQKQTTTDYQSATRTYSGKSAIPDLRGGLGINAGYKGFSLSVRFTYAIGGYGYDFVYARLMDNGIPGSNNWHKDIENRWQQPGDITNVPRLSANLDKNVAGTSTRFLIKKDYLNLNNVRLGYNFPTKWIEGLGMNKLNIYVSGTNLALWNKRDGFNPMTSEAGGSDWYTYSPLSTLTAGINVSF